MSRRIGRWIYNSESTRYGEAGWHLDGGPIVLDWMPACDEGCEPGIPGAERYDSEHYDCCWSLYGWPDRIEAEPVSRYLPDAMAQIEQEYDESIWAALAAIGQGVAGDAR